MNLYKLHFSRACPLSACFLALCCFKLLAVEVSAQALKSACRPDQILVKPKVGISATTLGNFHAAGRGRAVRTFDKIGGLQIVRLPEGGRVEDYISWYQAGGLVEFAEPDYFAELTATPNDPRFLDGTLWALNNIGQIGTADADIDAPEGWDILNSASNVIVAVIDTGIRSTHEDLAVNMWTNTVQGGHGFNALTGSYNSEDDNGHGTIMAGVIGAVGNNGLGSVGVAWRVQLMACKSVSASGSISYSDLIEGADFARAHGARVVNISLGAYSYSQGFFNALASLRDVGIICVASSGNDGNDNDRQPFYPGSFNLDNMVAVAATSVDDSLSNYSNYGSTNVDLAAPGDNIFSTDRGSDSSYTAGTGTSIATPCVTGALALLVAAFPGESHQQIISRLLNGTDPLPTLAGKCVSGGRLNLRRALSGATSQPPSLKIISAPGGPTFQIRLSGVANQTYVIETSADLFTWQPVQTNSASLDGTFDYTETGPGAAQRFFRARTLP